LIAQLPATAPDPVAALLIAFSMTIRSAADRLSIALSQLDDDDDPDRDMFASQ
jgi:hypothetical protein